MNIGRVVNAVALTIVFCGAAVAQQDLKHPVGYLNAIGAEYNDISKAQWDYARAVGHGKSARKVEKRRQELLSEISEARRKIQRLPAFDGKTNLRDSTVAYLNVSYYVTNDDYAKIVDLEEVAERSYDDMEAYLLAKQLASEKVAQAADNVDIQQDLFASENNVNLVEKETKLGKKMKQAGKVFEYYNDLYLAFFKSYKQEVYMMEALGNRDVNAIEQNKDALAKYSKEGRERIKSRSSFQGDPSLYISCRQILQFYSEEAEEKIPIMLDYYLQAEKFEKIKAAFDNIKPNKRTQENIDQYNDGVKAINAASQKYNEVNEELNKKRSKMINMWNKKGASFLDKHIP